MHMFLCSLEKVKEGGKEEELDVCEERMYSMSEVHSGLDVYKALIDLRLMANGWSVFFRSL